MQFDINQEKVDKAVTFMLRELSGGQFNKAEALVAMSEALARSIVAMCENAVQLRECVEIFENHMHATVTAGAMAKGIPTDRSN